jgi:hypothetical protein
MADAATQRANAVEISRKRRRELSFSTFIWHLIFGFSEPLKHRGEFVLMLTESTAFGRESIRRSARFPFTEIVRSVANDPVHCLPSW